MSAVYLIKNPKVDPHWTALIHSVSANDRIVSGDDFSAYVDDLNSQIAHLNGKLVLNKGTETGYWINGIEFNTEEELVIFKLIFN